MPRLNAAGHQQEYSGDVFVHINIIKVSHIAQLVPGQTVTINVQLDPNREKGKDASATNIAKTGPEVALNLLGAYKRGIIPADFVEQSVVEPVWAKFVGINVGYIFVENAEGENAILHAQVLNYCGITSLRFGQGFDAVVYQNPENGKRKVVVIGLKDSMADFYTSRPTQLPQPRNQVKDSAP